MALNDYTRIGFNQYLAREFQDADLSKRSLLSEDEFNTIVEGVSGSKITSGLIRSKDGTLRINLDSALLELFEGSTPVVQIGKFDDGTRGFRLVDARGNNINLSLIEFVLGAQTIVAGRENTARMYIDKLGVGGRNRLVVQFNKGQLRVLATEP